MRRGAIGEVSKLRKGVASYLTNFANEFSMSTIT